tara:strand:- start:21372 stop:21581 length:210 start_codon:yes stop_codon:yes gene_type:complete
MRTNIEIDDELMEKALQISAFKTKKDVVNEALKVFVQRQAQKQILNYFGKLEWEGDLDEMRESRFPEWL